MSTSVPQEPGNLLIQARKNEESGRYKEAADLYLESALGFAKIEQVNDAITSLMSAARTFEKEQDWRKIGAIWERVGDQITSQLAQKSLDSTTIDSLFHHRVVKINEWEDMQDLNHRAAWAFQWSAQHFEKAGEYVLASMLFSKAGYFAETTKDFLDNNRWAGMMFEKATVYSILVIAAKEMDLNQKTVLNSEELMSKMEENYRQIGKKDKRNIKDRYLYLSRGYRNIRIAFQTIGDLVVAEEILKKELDARSKYERSSKKYFQARITWLVSNLWVLPVTWIVLVFTAFPLVYWTTQALVTNRGSILWYDYVSFSVMVATTSGYGYITPSGAGVLITMIELVFSYFTLALVVASIVQYFMRIRSSH